MGAAKPEGGLFRCPHGAVEKGQIKTGIHMLRTQVDGLLIQGHRRVCLTLLVQVKGSVENIVRIAGAWPAIFGSLPGCLHRA
jgi:hypothetical protein